VEAAVGARVAAPFGPGLVTGIVAAHDPDPPPGGTAERDVLAVLDEGPFLPRRSSASCSAPRPTTSSRPGSSFAPRSRADSWRPERPPGSPGPPRWDFEGGSPLERDVLREILSRGQARLDELGDALGRAGSAPP